MKAANDLLDQLAQGKALDLRNMRVVLKVETEHHHHHHHRKTQDDIGLYIIGKSFILPLEDYYY